MSQNIVPDSHENRLNFFKNLKVRLVANTATLNLDPTFVSTISALLDSLIAAYQTLVDAEQAAVAASADAATVFAVKAGALRGLFNNLKSNVNMTAGIATAMGILPTISVKPPTQIKPKIKAEAQAGHVRLSGSKDYAELVDIYMRIVGTIPWKLVGIRRKKLPFEDPTPLQTAGVPETREYQAIGVIGDDEVGLPSDIVTVTYAG